MATTAQVQAQLDATGKAATIIRSVNAASAVWSHYVVGGVNYAGRSGWVDCATASSASAQAADIASTLRP